MTKHKSSWDESKHAAKSRLYSTKYCRAYLVENMRPDDKKKALYYLNNMEVDDNGTKLFDLQSQYVREEAENNE
jgi:hypothetical protein